MNDIKKIQEFFSKSLEEATFKVGDKVTYLGHPGEITGINKEMTGAITYNVAYDKGNGRTKATNIDLKSGAIKLAEAEEKYTVAGHSVTLNKGKKTDGTDWTVTFKNGKSKPLSDVLALIKPMPKGITMNEAKEETGVDMAKKQLDALGVKYEMSKTDKVRPFKVIYRPINKSDKFYDEFEDIVDLFNLKGFVKSSIKENNSIDYTKLISLIKSANNPRNLPIYYNSDNGVVNIGGVGYDKGELVKMFNSQPGQSLDIKNLFYKANQNPEETKNAIESMDPSIKVEIGYGYGNEPFVKYIKALMNEDFAKFDTLKMAINQHEKGEPYYDKTRLINIFNQLDNPDQERAKKEYSEYFGKSVNESNGFKSGKEFINIKLQKYPKAVAKINQLISIVGESNFTMEMAEWLFDFFNNASYESPVNEAKSEDKVDTITMDIPLFLRMLEYSREDAEQDLDLHDVTEKANKLGKERGILQMDDYEEIVGTTEKVNEVNLNETYYQAVADLGIKKTKENLDTFEEVQEFLNRMEKRNAISVDITKFNQEGKSQTIKYNWDGEQWVKISKSEIKEVNLKQAKLSSAEYQKAKKLKDFKASDWKWNADEDLYTKVNEATDYMKRRKAMDDYAVNKKDKPAKSYNPTPSGKTDYMKSREKGLEEKISEALNKINEELCPAGKAYIKRRKAAGEKSSAYLSGRAVKVCKGQMSGKSKKK
jgi:hypothetical protein